MKIPSREECYRLLDKYNFPEKKKKHVELVAKVAVFLGEKIKDKGDEVNIALVYAGGILHDIDKGLMEEGDIHTDKGVKILEEEGYPEVARICVSHRVDAFLDPKTIPTTWEEKCIALADKMVKDEIIGVTERFRLWNEENLPEEQKEILRKSYPLVKDLEREILGIIGIGWEEIKFLKFKIN